MGFPAHSSTRYDMSQNNSLHFRQMRNSSMLVKPTTWKAMETTLFFLISKFTTGVIVSSLI